VLVAIAVEMSAPIGLGKIRMRRIDRRDCEHLMLFMPASSSQGWSFTKADRRLTVNSMRPDMDIGALPISNQTCQRMKRCQELTTALLQRWMLGTYQGVVQIKQFDYSVDEFVFRFNRHASKSRGLLFYRLLQQTVVTPPATNKTVIGSKRKMGFNACGAKGILRIETQNLKAMKFYKPLISLLKNGGGGRDRTGVNGFAGRCITTLLPRHWGVLQQYKTLATPIKNGSQQQLPFQFWSGRRVSNSRPQPWQGCALPTELLPHQPHMKQAFHV
jgi:hypothetical protein